MAKSSSIPAGMTLRAEVPADYASILTPEALDFIAGLARKFEPDGSGLLARRAQRQAELDCGASPIFCPRRIGAQRRLDHRRRCRPNCRTGASRSPARRSARC